MSPVAAIEAGETDSSASRGKNALAAIEAGEEHLRSAQPLDAQALFREALKALRFDPRARPEPEMDAPIFLRALHGLSAALLDEGTQQARLAALGYATQARSLAESDPEAHVRTHVLLGRIKLKLDDLAGAQAEFERAGAVA